ncbi:hypothetical protein E2C01_085114 [Portunus trituberculatus]|uniref:Uncharacterized protein n=1 Tax=Portunus trituberculatus TaxID=210409 RepID=A0A5B7J1R1_PORTR|nr:hypothetical protein [Portunus trituberculatus]
MSSSGDDAEAIVAYRKLQRKRKCLRMRPWLNRREEGSVYYILLPELSLEDPDTMRQWMS